MKLRMLWKFARYLQKWRVKLYRYMLSERNGDVWKFVRVWQPVIINGTGEIKIGEEGKAEVIIGWIRSPNYYIGNSYIEARFPTSRIEIGAGTFFNNSCTIIANTTAVSIGKNCRIGFGCVFFDSDFHGIHPADRDLSGDILPDAPIVIGDNVFCGSNVTVLKGVSIGDGSIIGAGSVVSKDVPPMSIAAGNPCKIIRRISDADKLDFILHHKQKTENV